MEQRGYASKNRLVVLILALIGMSLSVAQAIITSEGKLSHFVFTPYAGLSAIALLINLGLLFYIVSKPARTDERMWLSVYLAIITLFATSELLQRLMVHPGAALYWANIGAYSSFVTASLYLFVLSYTSQSERRYVGLTALLFAGAIITAYPLSYVGFPFTAATAAKLYPWGYYAVNRAGVLTAIGSLFWAGGLTFAAIARLIHFRRKTSNPILRKQSLIFIIAAGMPLILALFTDTVLPSIGFTSLPPMGTLILTFAAAILTYGAVRYKVLSISPTLFSNTILSIMQEAVVVADDTFTVHYVNPKAETLLGIAADAKNKRLLDVLGQSTVPAFEQALKADNSKSDTFDIERIDVASHDRMTPVRIVASRLHLADISMWVFALSDITKELQVRSVIEHEVQVRTRELHEARTYLISSINSLEQGFALVNNKGGIELLNDEARKLFGLKAAGQSELTAEVLDMSGWSIDIYQTIAASLDAGKANRVAVATEGGNFYQVYVTPVLAGDHVLGATVVIQDVTEQKILDRSKDEFFSIASHELRTPLTAIRGNMSMFRDYFPDALKDEGAKQLVDDAHAASVRLIEIVSDFLDSSSLEQGKTVFNLVPVMIAPLVASIQDDLKVLSDQQHNTMTAKDLDQLPAVTADEGRLRQVLYNLLSNANKYCEHGMITVSGELHEQHVTIRVQDTGKGIDPEHQKLLFHKFQQAGDPLTRDNTKGTGLGLYIAKLLLNNMHGSVALERSEAGKGSTFVVMLQVADRNDHATAHHKEVASET